jgi:hypothetical protein
MGIAKRPKLATRYTGPRSERDTVSLEARCRVGEGDETTVAVLDLDARGCRVRGITAAVTKGAPVELWLGSVGPIAARLRWVKLGSAGLAFETPLADEALADARSSAMWVAPPRVIPLRRPVSDAGT